MTEQGLVTPQPQFADKTDGLGEEFDEAFAESSYDPAVQHIVPDEDATPAQEKELGKALFPALEFVYGDGMAHVISVLKKGGQPYMAASKVAAMVVRRYKPEGADPAIFFGDGGMLQTVLDSVFEVGQQVGIAGMEDPDQYAAALMASYKHAGDYIIEKGDDQALGQVEDLMLDMTMTREDGSMIESAEEADAAAMALNQQNQLTSSVQQGLRESMTPRRMV